MQKVAGTIEDVIHYVFPEEYFSYVTSSKINLNDLVLQILVECCKYAHDMTKEKHSLRYYLGSSIQTEDAVRMMYQRTVKYIKEHREIESEYWEKRGIHIEGLVFADKKDIQQKREGYGFNSFQFWEIMNVHDMQLVKAVVDRKITKKNFTTEQFREYAAEYDDALSAFKENFECGNDITFNFLAMFTLEWKYSFDFYYELANEMVQNDISEIPDVARRLAAFCGMPLIDSRLLFTNPEVVSERIHTDSRMLILRRRYVHDIVTLSKSDFEDELDRFIEGIVIIFLMLNRMTYRGIPIREWFCENSDADDWESVFREYDVYQAFVANKDWSDKRKIRYIKELYNQSSFDYKNPDFRS